MVLVTGGAGYIGSHICVELLGAGYELIVLDNLCNSKPEVLPRVQSIAGQPLIFVEGDVRDRLLLDQLFTDYPIDAVVHLAGLKAIGQSVECPLYYYDNNVTGSTSLLQVMHSHRVKTLVFSSSATVYGDPYAVPIKEDFPLKPANPYGRSKLMVEDMLRDLYRAEPEWHIAILRYFNPVGAHDSGLIGEDPNGVPNNLMPYISQVASGELPSLKVFGNDYPTPDGTGVRDYIHVVDLAIGHVKALNALLLKPGLLTVNLGSGRGYSVLEVVKAFEQACGRPIACEAVGRRPGDVAICYADPALAMALLGWKTERGLSHMCASSWEWQRGASGCP